MIVLLLLHLFLVHSSTNAATTRMSNVTFKPPINGIMTLEDWAHKLELDLFNDGYSVKRSPFSYPPTAINKPPPGKATMILEYARLANVDERAQLHRNLVGLRMFWQDPRLRWNPSDYGGVEHLYINFERVWMPEIYACECVDSQFVAHSYAQFVKLNSSGHMEWFREQSIIYTCDFDAYAFPFDVQHCWYCFTIGFYRDDEFILTADIMREPEPFIYSTTDWGLDVLGARKESYADGSENFYFNIRMTRRPQFWVALIIVPTFLLVNVILLGLFFGGIGDTINNSVNLGLTTMMSMTVSVGILNDALGKSETLPVLGWFVLLEIVIITCAVFTIVIAEYTRRKLRDRWKRTPTKYVLRAVIFVIFLLLHISNLMFLMSNAWTNH